MRKNIFIALLGLLSGIGIFISYETINPLYILIMAGLSAIIFLFFDRKLFIFPLALAIGFILSSYELSSYKLINNPTSKLEITILEKRKVDDSYRYFVKARAIGLDEKAVVFSEEDFDIADKYIVDGDISLANKNTNPNLFNYRNYLLSKGITANIKINKIYRKGYSNSLLLKSRDKFYTYIHKVFEENLDKEKSDFVISVILGENITENDDLRELGLAHILAVSGLHLDLLIGFILFLFRK